MPKPKPNKSKRENANTKSVTEQRIIDSKQNYNVSIGTSRKHERQTPFSPDESILIVCEGETEAAYFGVLRDTYELNKKFKIEILPQKGEMDGHKGSSIKGLLYEAMKEMKNNTYDHVWIVTDNDEGNAYKLDEGSLERIKKNVPTHIYDKLVSKQMVAMNVRQEDVDKGKKHRIRYFLSYSDYEYFLTTEILNSNESNYITPIIKATAKKNDFYELYSQNPNSFFLDNNGQFINSNDFEEKYFDANWQEYVKTAYTCIAFEHWILLHFEINAQPFYNSREIIRYFDVKNYFNSTYDKGWYLYENRENATIKAFFKSVHKAITNNLILNTQMQPQIAQGKHFYEVNPYSDVNILAYYLLKSEYLKIVFLNTPLTHAKLELSDIYVTQNQSIINIYFYYNRSQSIFKKDIESFFPIFDERNKAINFSISVQYIHFSIQKGDKVELKIELPSNYSPPCFLYLKNTFKKNNYAVVWLIC